MSKKWALFLVLGLIIVLVLPATSSCNSAVNADMLETQDTVTPGNTSPVPPFEAGMNMEQESYLSGEEVRYGISIRNLSSGILTIDPFPAVSWIKPADSDEAIFTDAAGDRTLDIGTDGPDSWYHTIGVWFQKNNNEEQVAPGWYEMGYEYSITEQSTGKKYTANPTARFQIVHPDSAMNKQLDINQSITAEGITIIFERIELDAVKAIVYIFFTPPGYVLPEDHPPYNYESLMVNSKVECRFDGGIIKQAVSSEGQFTQTGVRKIWELDPVPLDAEELTFKLTRLGDWEGPWEFKINLK